jgi:hypothetical protein
MRHPGGRPSEAHSSVIQRTVSAVARDSAADLVSTMNALALEQTSHDPTDPPAPPSQRPEAYEGYGEGYGESQQQQEYYDANGYPQQQYGGEYNQDGCVIGYSIH